MREKEQIFYTLKYFNDNNGGALYCLALYFKNKGMSQEYMTSLFESVRVFYDSDLQDSKEYNSIIDTMDYIVGWCDKTVALYG